MEDKNNCQTDIDEELIDQCDEIRAIAAKNWTRPASVSLARLDQVKATVYNLGLSDSRDLKAKTVLEKNQRNQFLSDLLTDPPLSTVSLQKNAWGSNTSIPELIKHHSETSKPVQLKTRPQSAKTTSCKPQTCKRNRPQSAKDPTSTSPSKNSPTIAVKGAKYDPNGRPPREFGMGPTVGNGWVGPPAGLRFDQDMSHPHLATISNTTIESEFGQFEYPGTGAPPAPCVSPEPEDGTLDNLTDVDSEQCESTKSLLLRKPTPESIHFSLPKADDDEGESDELDTERLLREAESHTNKYNSLARYDHKSGISYIPPETADTNKLFAQEEEQPSGRKSPSLYDINARTLPLSAPPTTSTQHTTRLYVRSAGPVGVRIREDRNVTVDITPRNLGRKVASLSAGRRVLPRNKKYYKSDYTNVKSRVNSGIDPSTIVTEKKTSEPSTPEIDLGLSVKPVTYGPTVNTASQPVPTVTVRYDDNTSDKSSSGDTQDKKKLRKEIDLVTMVSQVSLTESEDIDEDDKSSILSVNNENCNNVSQKSAQKFLQPPCNQKLYKSQTGRNYYDIAMRVERGKSPDRSTIDEKENLVYKTTKTIEFDGSMPVETTERNIIQGSFVLSKPRDKLSVNTDYLDKMRNSPRNSTASIKVPCKEAEKELEASTSNLGFASLSPEDLEILAKAASKSEEQMSKMFLAPPSNSHNQRRGRLTKPPRPPNKTKSAKKEREPTADENIIKIHTESIVSINMIEGENSEDSTLLRPGSCIVSSERTLTQDTRRIQSAAKAERGPRSSKSYASYSQSKLPRRKESWDEDTCVFINTKKAVQELETEENLACQEMHARMAELGCNVRPETLERALFPPTGKTLYYDLQCETPMSPSDGLLSHPRFWLPKEYNKYKIAEKQLARADHLLWLQRREDERRTRSAMELKAPGRKKKKKGKIGGKKTSRSNSIC